MRNLFHSWMPALFAIIIALLAGGGLMALFGYHPVIAYVALFDGAFGSLYGLSETCVKTCPLLITGLGVALAFRCGVWNIGADGQFLVGATLAAWLGVAGSGLPGWILYPVIIIFSFMAGGIWAGVASVLKATRGVSEVIGTIMLNFIALYCVSFAVHGPLMEAKKQFPQSDAVAESVQLSRFLPPTRLHTGVLYALIAAGLLYIILFRTTFGYRIRAVGLNPTASAYAGIDVPFHIIAAMGVSGGLAGCAGVVELLGVTYRLYGDFSPGYGYTAIAVALLGNLHPFGVILAALLFGALNAGAGAMQRTAGVSAVMVSVIQAIMIFTLVGYKALQNK
jgi:simple sugar transport system permease protein